MAFDALVHRATGILYFSYWPKAPLTWASVSDLNREIETLVPFILAKHGTEVEAKSSWPEIHVRARRVGDAWMILAVNVQPKHFIETITVAGLGDATLRVPRDGRAIKASAGTIADRFAPFEAKAYLVGNEPQ
jgi:hypothetical protein